MAWELARTPVLASKAGLRPPIRRVADLTEDHILGLKEHLPWAGATFRLHFSALRPFLEWAHNPVARSSRIWSVATGDTGRRRWLAKEFLVRLFRASRGREQLLIALEGFNGLRRIEVLRLRVQDVHIREGFMNVHGKGRNGGKWRQVPICPTLLPILARGLRHAGGEGRLVPLSSSGADLLLLRAAKRAGLARRGIRVSHHDLRRTFGRLSHEAGMDLVQLKNLYGHSSLDQTVHYIGLDQAEMRKGLTRLEGLLRPLMTRPNQSPVRGLRPRVS
jgi:integrase